ncbi:hypothetical protein J6590_013291 [Homalodisca vitripennis]|nr:hypothetical protein J6590_013291 [Homalodisca vitripennis]
MEKNTFNSLIWSSIMQFLKDKDVPNYLVAIISSYSTDRMLIYSTDEGQAIQSISRSAAGIYNWTTLVEHIWKQSVKGKAIST